MQLPKCISCKFFVQDGKNLTCKAFPEEIPNEKMWAPDDEECVKGIKYEEG